MSLVLVVLLMLTSMTNFAMHRTPTSAHSLRLLHSVDLWVGAQPGVQHFGHAALQEQASDNLNMVANHTEAQVNDPKAIRTHVQMQATPVPQQADGQHIYCDVRCECEACAYTTPNEICDVAPRHPRARAAQPNAHNPGRTALTEGVVTDHS